MKKVYFITIASKLLIKCLECMGVAYDVSKGSDNAISATLTDTQIDFICDLIGNHDYLASCYDQEEYEDFLHLATTKKSMTIM